jgi:hypothetical protein
MRRALLGLAATTITLLALAGTASAASDQVTHFKFTGTFANAFWFTSSATSATGTSISVSKSSQGSRLFVERFTSNYDTNGNITGSTDTSVVVTSGFSFALQQPLASASLSGSGLPATTCTYDANFNQIGCSATTIDVTAAWTGQGPILRGVSNLHFKTDGFSETDHSNGTDRNAVATGTFNGDTLTASELQYADLGTTNSGSIYVCIGTSCQ